MPGSGAVFLSYASQDAEAVQRIADALREGGIEVWFDQNELRGGDAWDEKIKRQVRDCFLFLPVISANTQSRAEGYFRREWRMAVERMYDMADDQPFLVPVVIDDTSDVEARVPDRFRERQWSRLRNGETGADFVGRVKKLLDPASVLFQPGQVAVRARKPWRPHALLTAFLVAAFFATGIMWFFLGGGTHDLPQFSRPQRVTTSSVLEDYPAISPDGLTVAYESNGGGRWDIWVSQPDAETPANRTQGLGGNSRYPSWSPDGSRIAFWNDQDGGGYYLMPAFGGSSKKFVATPRSTVPSVGPAAWSGDGNSLTIVRYGPEGDEPKIEKIDLSTRQSRDWVVPGEQEARLDLAWSPDGTLLAYIDAAQQPAETTTLRVLRIADGESVALTAGADNVRSPVWLSNGRGLLFTSNRSGLSDFWFVGIDERGHATGEPTQVTTAMEIRHASFTPNRNTMAYSQGRWVSNIWRVPILKDRVATWDDAEPVTDDHAFIEFLSLSRNGKQLAFSSDRLGNQEIWTMTVGATKPTRLTSHPAQDWGPDWSPDGEMISFYSNRTGDREIWIMPSSGEPARQLTHSPGLDAAPRWSPDGREVIFRSERDGNSDIWAAAIDGSGERQITSDPSGDYAGIFSPDGEWVYFTSQRSGEMQIWRTPARGGKTEAVTGKGIAGSMCWSPDGRFLYFGVWGTFPHSFWAYSVDEGRAFPICDFSGKRGGPSNQPPATDGEYLYFAWREDLGDIWMMDVSWE